MRLLTVALVVLAMILAPAFCHGGMSDHGVEHDHPPGHDACAADPCGKLLLASAPIGSMPALLPCGRVRVDQVVRPRPPSRTAAGARASSPDPPGLVISETDVPLRI